MKTILVLNLVILLMIMGCAGSNCHVSTSENAECQRIECLFNNLEKNNVKTVAFLGEDSNEPIDEVAT